MLVILHPDDHQTIWCYISRSRRKGRLSYSNTDAQRPWLACTVVIFDDGDNFTNGVARMLKSFARQREITGSSNDSLQLHLYSKWELLLKERICSHGERILSFVSSSLKYGKSLYHIRWPPLNVTIFITHVRNLRNGCYAMLHWLNYCTTDFLKMWAG